MEIETLVNKSQEEAITALKNFIKNIGLNEKFYNHLYNTQMLISPYYYKEDEEEANYYHNDNYIELNKKVLERHINDINKGKATEKTVVLNTARAIVHELLHANRTVLHVDINKHQQEINLISEFPQEETKDEKTQKEMKTVQTSFEEIITDALATIIILTRKQEKLDLESATEIIIENEEDERIVLGAEIINNMGIDMLKWFMTAAYENVYYDKFALTFQEKYDELLEKMHKLYENKATIEEQEEIEDIIYEKTGKRR